MEETRNPRINNPAALEWILNEMWKKNHTVKGDIRQFLSQTDIPKMIVYYNERLEEGIRHYSREEADLYAKQEVKKYMDVLLDHKRKVVSEGYGA